MTGLVVVTQLMHRREGARIRRFLLMRPFGPALELDDAGRVGAMPEYDAEFDLRPRRPQLESVEVRPEDRVVLPWVAPDLAVGCDRKGACCSQYPTIPVTVEEANRVVEVLRGHDGPASVADGFGPAELVPNAALTPVMQGDGCQLLGSHGCRVHQIGGAMAKPWTCRQYPLQVVHCGDHLEVSVLPQCACAARTTQRVSGGDWPSSPLDGLTSISMVPEIVVVDAARALPRDAYLTWVRTLADLLIETSPASPVPRLDEALRTLGGPTSELSSPWLKALVRAMDAESIRLRTFMVPQSPLVQGVEWVADVARERLEEAAAIEPIESSSDNHVLALALRAHALLERPSLLSTLLDVARIARFAGVARAVIPAEAVDARLETMTLLMYLWAASKWPVDVANL